MCSRHRWSRILRVFMVQLWRTWMRKVNCRAWLSALLFLSVSVAAEHKPRARDLGVPFDGNPGPLNAITDVKGVEVGHTTLISGEGKLKVGVGPVRTGVTAVLPRGKGSRGAVFAAWFRSEERRVGKECRSRWSPYH